MTSESILSRKNLTDPAVEREPGEAQSATVPHANINGPSAVLSGPSDSPTPALPLGAVSWPERRWQKCPVCGGNGLVPNGFYTQTTGQWTTSSTTPEKCRSCNGLGRVL